MITLVRNVIRSRELLLSLSESYLKARYKQTALGAIWAILPPTLLMGTALFLMPRLTQIPPSLEPYPLFVFIGFWMWTFFANALSFAVPNLVQNTPLLRKVYFPREILVIAAIVPSIFDFVLGIPILAILIWFYHVPAHITVFLLPFVFLVELILVMGIALAGAILNIAFRDVAKFLPIVLQILLFSTPVIYATESMSPLVQPYIAFNPLAGILNAARSILMPQYVFHWKEFGLSVGISCVLLYLGYVLFKTGERTVVDIM